MPEKKNRVKLSDLNPDKAAEYHKAAFDLGLAYDKVLLTLSGGALALSIGFVDRVVNDPIVKKGLLFVSWTLLLGSLVLLLAAYVRAVYETVNPVNLDTPGSRPRNWAWTLSAVAGGFFVIGMAFLALFAALNI